MNDEIKYVKQVIVIRKDLKMRKGKFAAQCAHAAMKVLLDRMEFRVYAEKSKIWENTSVLSMMILDTEPLYHWLRGSFTKIVVGVNSEEELMEIKGKADAAGILTALVIDAGRTEFHGVPTKTAIAVGPDWSDKIDLITGHLVLM